MFVKAASKKAAGAVRRVLPPRRSASSPLLPAGLAVPRLLWSHEDDLWVVLGFEYVEGRTRGRPWGRAELDACLDTLAEVAEAMNPVPAGFDLRRRWPPRSPAF